MRVLVTGGSGFIGTHLCRALRHRGYEVRVLDLAAPVHPVSGVHYAKGDVRNPPDIEAVIGGIDAVFHLAALVSVPLCQELPVLSYQTNVAATAILLDVVRREMQRQRKPIRFIFSSTSAVYGNPNAFTPAREDESLPLNPLSFYGTQKFSSEQAIRMFHLHYKIPALVYRLFNVYGPGQNPKSPYAGVISIFSDSIASGQDLKLNGGGEQVRDFVSIHDVVRCLCDALPHDLALYNALPINLGSGQGITIRDLALMMIDISRQPVDLQIAPERRGDIRYSSADIQRALDWFGWRPRISLREGLQEMLQSTAVSPGLDLLLPDASPDPQSAWISH